MLNKSKEEMIGAARIILNNLHEFYHNALRGKGAEESAQVLLESEEWVHVYNLAQRMLFINNSDLHFGVLGMLERVATAEARDNDFNLRYHVIEGGLKLQFVSIDGTYLDLLEIWCIDRAIHGLKLNMPSGKSL